jgi:Tol biopolymer transport system component
LSLNHDAHQSILMSSTRVDAVPSFSPNDRRIAFLSDRSGSTELWLATSRGDSAIQITHAGRFAGTPAWAPDGGHIALERRAETATELWVVDVERHLAQKVSTSVRDPIAPTWSRDGQSILVGSKESGSWEIWRLNTSGGAASRITTSGGVHGIESLDGKSLLFTKPASGGLWLRDLASVNERLLVESVPAGDWTNWAIGRDKVYFVDRDTTGAQRIVAIPFASGRSRILASNVVIPIGTGGLTLSHDERAVVFAQLDRREGNLFRVALK